jgi:heme-degrading monooxygenase HmoA
MRQNRIRFDGRAGLLYIFWEFHAKPEKVAEFERAYGSEGDWARLFRKSLGYKWTTLGRDLETPGRYLVTDVWEDAAAFQSFKANHKADYEELDRNCEQLTLKETRIGNFEPL